MTTSGVLAGAFWGIILGQLAYEDDEGDDGDNNDGDENENQC